MKTSAKKNQAGQTTIEFIFSLLVLLSFSVFFMQSALTMVFGNYVQYATFMAARAYLSGGKTTADQTARAKAVMTRMIYKGDSTQERFASIARGVDAGPSNEGVGLFIGPYGETGIPKDDVDLRWMRGVRYSFRARLIPMLGGGGKPTASAWTLTSESWLGRDPSQEDCMKFMSDKGWKEDNGC